MDSQITQKELKVNFSYDPSSGDFIRLTSGSGKNNKVGVIAGSKINGYVSIKIKQKSYFAHRLAWLYLYGYMPKSGIDHRNGDTADNKISNLRMATVSQNKQNLRGPRADNKSGFLGVCWNKSRKRWHAQINVDGKVIHLGYFDDAKIAHETYLEYKRKFHEFCTI